MRTTFFWLVGLVVFFRVLFEKTVFGWSVVYQLFQSAQNVVEWLKTMGSVFCEFRAKTFRERNARMGLTKLN